MSDQVPESQLASDGTDVLPGVAAPSDDELAKFAALSEDEQAAALEAHIADADAWAQSAEGEAWKAAQRGH